MPIERHDLIAWHRLRSHLRVCAMAALALGQIGCSKTPSQPPEQSNPGPNVGSTSEAQRQERAERIRAYFKERTGQKEVVVTARIESGQVIDWIRPESQIPAGQKLAVAPTRARATMPPNYLLKISKFEKPPAGAERLAQTEVQTQPRARGRKGTVPVVRFDVENYLKTERDLPENPAEVLKKIPPPSPDSNSRYYGVWQRFDTFFGTSGRINIWSSQTSTRVGGNVCTSTLTRDSRLTSV